MSENPAPREDPYPAEKARQGEIILTHKSTRWIFFAGLAGFVALVLVLAIFGR